jgi:hypothetical protein
VTHTAVSFTNLTGMTWRGVVVICSRVARDYKSSVRYMMLQKVGIELTIRRSNPETSTRFGATLIWGMGSKTIHWKHVMASWAEHGRCAHKMPSIQQNTDFRIECSHSMTDHSVFKFTMSERNWAGFWVVPKYGQGRVITFSSGMDSCCKIVTSLSTCTCQKSLDTTKYNSCCLHIKFS